MAANVTPIFLAAPVIQFSALSTSAVTGTDGTDANIRTIFTADATNGGKVEKVCVRHLGTNSNATVIRFFINNGSDPTVATNNSLVYEASLAANTIVQNAASVGLEIELNLALPAGYRLRAASGTAIPGGVQVSAAGGSY